MVQSVKLEIVSSSLPRSYYIINNITIVRITKNEVVSSHLYLVHILPIQPQLQLYESHSMKFPFTFLVKLRYHISTIVQHEFLFHHPGKEV